MLNPNPRPSSSRALAPAPAFDRGPGRAWAADRARGSVALAVRLLALASAAALASCGGGGGGSGLLDQLPSQIGAPNAKPGSQGVLEGATYIVDPHQGGSAGSVRVAQMFWGRLVDILDVPVGGGPRVIYPDIVIGDDVRTEVGKWTLSSNPVTGRGALEIQRENTPDPADDFDLLVAEALGNLGPILPKGTSLNEAPPFSYIARNSALVIQFDDLIDSQSISLNESVRVLTGNPPVTPFDCRLVWDRNHGGISPLDGAFHSTRLIFDMTVDQSEQLLQSAPLALNGAGLPASIEPLKANVAVVIPTKTDPSVGQFLVARNLVGKPLAVNSNGPIDASSSTLDVVRAMRSGNASDTNNGFLSDSERPRIIGRQGIQVNSVSNDPLGLPGYDFVVGFSFQNPACSISPAVGDVVQIGNASQLTVAQVGSASQGTVAGLRVRLPLAASPKSPQELLATGQLISPWRPQLQPLGLAPCFVRFQPNAAQAPATSVDPGSQILLEFSEAMDPLALRPFDSFTVRNKPSTTSFRDFVVGDVFSTADLRQFRFAPLLPLNHQQGVAESYFVDVLAGSSEQSVTDLAGNSLLDSFPQVPFTLAASALSTRTGGFALRFAGLTEDELPGQDLRGQFLYDFAGQRIRPRPFTSFSAIADRTVPILGKMQIIATGLQTPLSNLGSKLHLMWRYADVGFPLEMNQEDSFVNLDVAGIALSPRGGVVTSTFYPQFEMRLGHSGSIPDEVTNGSNDPTFPISGFPNDGTFAQNYLSDPLNVPQIVHPRELGFLVSNAQVFTASTGTPMLHFPMNRTVEPEDRRYYSWRDTAIQGWGGRNPAGTGLAGPGVPITFDVESAGLAVPGDVGYEYGGTTAPNKVTPAGIPSVGLPILMEFRCYPGESLSVNNFDVSIASTSNIRPFFRAFSTGGFNTQGTPVLKDPDAENTPTGGFNGSPLLGQIGAPTPPRDPTVYMGQLDLVTRISRVHTVLFDSQQSNPDYAGVVLEPRNNQQPAGTEVVLAYRGDDSPNLSVSSEYFDSALMDVYGEGLNSTNETLLSNPTWDSSANGNDGNRYIQLRITFVSNPVTTLSPTLSGLGLAWRF